MQSGAIHISHKVRVVDERRLKQMLYRIQWLHGISLKLNQTFDSA